MEAHVLLLNSPNGEQIYSMFLMNEKRVIVAGIPKCMFEYE